MANDYDDLPDIPAFLRRENTGKKPKRHYRAHEGATLHNWAPMTPTHTPPKGFEPVTLHLGDELPHVGSGVRRVHVKVGRKWAWIWSPSCGYSRRMLKTKFEALCLSAGRLKLGGSPGMKLPF